MSQQVLDLRRFMQIVRRRKILVGIVMILGLLAGVAYGVLNRPLLTSTALVALPHAVQGAGDTAASSGSDSYIATQAVIADSDRVLSGALPNIRPTRSLDKLRHEIQIGSPTSYIISISATSKVATDAEATANAVANSYVSYVTGASSPLRSVSASVLEPATSATGKGPLEILIVAGLIGAVGGTLIGAVVSLAISRNDRRLRERDEIANSIGVPVLGALRVAHPSDAVGWSKLLEDYRPAAVHAWQLRKALQQLGIPGDTTSSGNGTSRSLIILSLSSDPRALAVGPQLAIFAASLGIPTDLIIGPQQSPDVTASLRTACAAPPPASSRRPGQLRVIASDDGHVEGQPAELVIFVAVVDSRVPQVPETIRATTVLLGVSAGAVTAEELARAAVSVAAEGREIAGIIVANPESGDYTTGHIPQLIPPVRRRMPTRLNFPTTEIRR